MAVATESALGTVLLAGDLAGSSNANSPQLTPTGVTPGVYKGASVVVDSKGRILHARPLAGYDVGCATATECGVVSVSANHHIDLTGEKVSIKKASADNYGVVKLGNGFSKDCCEIFVDYPEATTTHHGVVTVPTSGNLLVDGAGNLSVPVGTTTVQGLVYAPVGGPITNTANTLSYTPPNASASVSGFVTVGNGFTVAAGELSIPTASASEKGLFRFNSSFTYASNTYSYPTVATASSVGLVKIGTGFVMDEDGTLNRGAGIASTIAKGIVQVPSANGLSVTGGVLTWAPSDATAAVKGVVQVGSSMTVSGGTVSMANASGTTTKGIVGVTSQNFTITNGMIDLGPNVVRRSSVNVYTKAQVTAKVNLTYSASQTIDFSLGQVFDLTLTGNVTLNTPTNMVNGGRHILILRQDATGSRTVTFSSDWQFVDSATVNATVARTIGNIPNSISILNITVANGKALVQIDRHFF